MDVVAAMKAIETTVITTPANQETTHMVASKRVAFVGGDTNLKVPTKVLTKEEKLVEAKMQREGTHPIKRLREAQQAVDAAARVATSMALDMQAKVNTHVRLAPIVTRAMLLIKQEGIVAMLPRPHR
jgi:hypothetical protein